MSTVLTLAPSPGAALSIRAKALLFHDPRSVALLQHVERVARSDATVLIVGETGTGKELVARHVHKVSGRPGPFVAVNCGAFSESLIDAELFGHEAGAFTGAARARAGWFEAASGGTLFLDEIGDLSLALQVKLLRVLQERQVVRIGSTRPIGLDVRLVAATNVELEQAVQAQHFRADLFYRLSVARVALPPLRERAGDILPLVEHFLALYGDRLNLHDVALSAEARACLLAYPWPGNIRELENAVHHALIVCRDGVIRSSDLHFALPLSMVRGAEAGPQTRARPADAHEESAEPESRLRTLFRELIEADHPRIFDLVEDVLVRTAYEHCRENQVQAARALGVTRNTLRTLLKRIGLLRADRVPEPAETGAIRPALQAIST
jgi:sigma-54-specific transcriptional regulator